MATRFGIHTPSDYNWVPSNLIQFCEDAKRHGVSWITGWWNCQVQVEFAKALIDHGIQVIYRPGENKIPSQFIGGDYDKYRAVGVKYCQFYNEPNLKGEWNKDIPWNTAPEKFAELWAQRCRDLKALGFIPVVPPLSPGGELWHPDFFVRMMNWWKNQGMLPDLLRGCVLGIHNRPITNPPDDPGICSFEGYRFFRDKMQEIMGFTIPMVAPEAGYEPQWVNYDWGRWQDWNLELIRRFRPGHPKYVGDDFLAHCFWILTDLGSTWDHCSLIGNWRYGQDHGGDTTTNLWRALESEDWGDVPQPQPPTPPVPPQPEPEPEPQPEVKMKAYLKDGSATDPAALLKAYAVTIEPITGSGFRVVEIRERCEAANCDVWVRAKDGTLMLNHPVRWGWPGTEVSQNTGPDGRAGFAMAPSAYYLPPQAGPHWTAIQGTSEVVRGIGMIVSTVHCTLNYTFQYTDTSPEPPQLPPEPPEPPTVPDIPYRLILGLDARLVAAGLAKVVDMRVPIEEQFVNVSEMEHNYKRDLDADNLKSITLHHTAGIGPLDVMAMARDHIQVKGWPHIAPHFCIDKAGTVWFTKKLAYHGPQAGNAQANRYGISIEVHGDFTKETVTDSQLKALRAVIESLEEFVGGGWGQCHPLPLVPHNCLVATKCPGNLYEKYREHLSK